MVVLCLSGLWTRSGTDRGTPGANWNKGLPFSLSFEAHTLREGFSDRCFLFANKHTHPRMASFSAVKPTVVTARPTVRALPRHARCRAPVARSMRMFR